MAKSIFLESRRAYAKEVINFLAPHFDYVSVLGTDVLVKSIVANKKTSNAQESPRSEAGFVFKANNGGVFVEYAIDDLNIPKEEILKQMKKLEEVAKDYPTFKDLKVEEEPLVEAFIRENDIKDYSDEELLKIANNLKDELLKASPKLFNAFVLFNNMIINKLFISKKKELFQHYGWANGRLMVIYQGETKPVITGEVVARGSLKEVIEGLPGRIAPLIKKAEALSHAKPIEPGIYDIITAPSISGLIAHEAFGHGVEMDQFVKDRAQAKKFVGKYVASPIVNMHDGAEATYSVASFFFDDDGVLAQDTHIIEDGILKQGLCDLTSATILHTAPTGNSRREAYNHKVYTRMTNTFFDKGEDSLADMIASIKHGYMLFETNNGMEDPKNWAIQCVADYGIEIVDGKLTDNYVSPVVISGHVVDLLKSISAVSNDFEVIGSGMCGKGYKEWVYVSDGGPCLKARAKLG